MSSSTPVPAASSLPSSAPSPPSVPPSYAPSSPPAAMSATGVDATTPSISESPSVPSSSTAPSSSADPPSTSMPSSVASSISSTSTTFASETSVQPSSPPPTTLQSSTPTSSPQSTSQTTTTASPVPSSSALSASDALSTTASTPPPSDLSSQSSPLVTDMPLTTVLQSTTIFITSTNSQGQVLTSVPPIVTEVITTTGSGGIATTVTQAVVNPTLAPNNSTVGGSSFFSDTGAVVGVFVVVGLASASIMMWILFALRSRQRMRRIEQDTVVEAAVAAAGLNRAPLDDYDDDDSPILSNTHHQFSAEMGQKSSILGLGGSGSLPTSARLSEVRDDPAREGPNPRPVEHRMRTHPGGYLPARTTSPSLRAEQCTDDPGSSRDRKSSYGHTPTYSAGSFEPLLANYTQNMSDQDTSALSSEPPQDRTTQPPGRSLGPNKYSSDGSPENGSRTSLKQRNSSDDSVFRADDEDYTRYVLMVRNVPDDKSQRSS